MDRPRPINSDRSVSASVSCILSPVTKWAIWISESLGERLRLLAKIVVFPLAISVSINIREKAG